MNSCGCRGNADEQRFPESGVLSQNKNLSLKELKQKLERYFKTQGEIYIYVLSSVEIKNGGFIQHGCAPNYQGGVVTLCTCKHQMRTRRAAEDWPGVWVAGFTSRRDSGCHRLFYLMKVAEAFESQLELWRKSELPKATKQLKCASEDKFGDLFRPLGQKNNPFDFRSYEMPIIGHKHRQTAEKTDWHNDICYPKSSKRPSLLVGKPELSFLWTKPLISIRKLPRNYYHKNLDWFQSFIQESKEK